MKFCHKIGVYYIPKKGKESMRKSTSSEFLNIRKENSGKVLAKQTKHGMDIKRRGYTAAYPLQNTIQWLDAYLITSGTSSHGAWVRWIPS